MHDETLADDYYKEARVLFHVRAKILLHELLAKGGRVQQAGLPD